jgi:hypothetical protein
MRPTIRTKAGFEAVDIEVDDGAFTDFDDLLFELFAHLGHHFFDTGRVNTAVGHEALER